MPVATWTLTDPHAGIDRPDWSIGPADVPGSPEGWSVTKRRLVGGKSDGVSVVEVDSGCMQFTFIPTRGMGIHRCVAGGRVLGWQSPVQGPVHPRFVPVAEPSGLGWLDGFDELLVRCGLVSNGPPEFDEQGRVRYPLHGRIANLPAHRVTVSMGEDHRISIIGEVDETRFLFHNLRLTSTISIGLGETAIHVHDVVENRSARPADFQMLYHVNVGAPLLNAGAELVAPVKTIVPRDGRAAEGVAGWKTYAGPVPGFEEQVYFCGLAGDDNRDTRVLVKNAESTEGFGLAFNTGQLPCFTQWKNTAASADGYVTGLEPATNFPNPRSFEERQGRVVPLAPGDTHRMDLQLHWCRDAQSVASAERAVDRLGAGIETQAFDAPQPGWCA
ncbi:MAG: aldose 1-epimerase family protein [Planctomycetaceae bacterium]